MIQQDPTRDDTPPHNFVRQDFAQQDWIEPDDTASERTSHETSQEEVAASPDLVPEDLEDHLEQDGEHHLPEQENLALANWIEDEWPQDEQTQDERTLDEPTDDHSVAQAQTSSVQMNAGQPEVPSSRYIVRTIDGLRMALAGFPALQPVQTGLGCGIEASTIADLRALSHVPHAVEVLVPYRLLPESIVSVNLLAPEWQDTER